MSNNSIMPVNENIFSKIKNSLKIYLDNKQFRIMD